MTRSKALRSPSSSPAKAVGTRTSPRKQIAWNDDVAAALVEALHAYPSNNIKRLRQTSAKQSELIQGYIHSKTGALPSTKQITDQIAKLNIQQTAVDTPRARQPSNSNLNHIPGQTTPTASSPLAQSLQPATSHVNPGAPYLPHMPTGPGVTNVSSPVSFRNADAPPSMSRRRLALNIPALRDNMKLPIPAPVFHVKDPMSSGSGSSRSSSPGAWLAAFRRPPLLRTNSSGDSSPCPHTPLDQMMHTPLNPPEIPRPAAAPVRRRRSQLNLLWQDRWRATGADNIYTPVGETELRMDTQVLHGCEQTTPSVVSSEAGSPFSCDEERRDTPEGELKNSSPKDQSTSASGHLDSPGDCLPTDSQCAPQPMRRPPALRRLSSKQAAMLGHRFEDSVLPPQSIMRVSNPSSPMDIPPAMASSPTLPDPSSTAGHSHHWLRGASAGESLASPLMIGHHTNFGDRHSGLSTPAIPTSPLVQSTSLSYFSIRPAPARAMAMEAT